VTQVPILKIWRSLVVSIQIDMYDQVALALQDDLTQELVSTRARGVLIDISALDLVDSFIGRTISNIAGMAKVTRRGDGRRWYAAGGGHHLS
jgi:rsbT antagonist protein RsbS